MTSKKHIRIRKLGGIDDRRKELWRAILRARDVLISADNDPLVTLKAVHAMQQACSAYARLVEASETEKRLAELEACAENGLGDD